MHRVSDGSRVLQFEGDEIGFASSERPGAARWIEFTLYRTAGDGKYVLSRVGPSNVYHTPECRFARQAELEAVPWDRLGDDAVPCYRAQSAGDGCHPDPGEFPLVCPERDRTWARVYATPEGVLGGLMKRNSYGDPYLTGVAKRLLDEASAGDPALAGAYRVQTVT